MISNVEPSLSGPVLVHSWRKGTMPKGVWGRALVPSLWNAAAQACFGSSEWPADRPVPQVSIEFEQADAASVKSAAEELEAKGYALLHAVREEPWGQTIARVLSPEGSIVGLSYAPRLHD